jgi:hypothetical protein
MMAAVFILLILLVVDSASCIGSANLFGTLKQIDKWPRLAKFGYYWQEE